MLKITVQVLQILVHHKPNQYCFNVYLVYKGERSGLLPEPTDQYESLIAHIPVPTPIPHLVTVDQDNPSIHTTIIHCCLWSMDALNSGMALHFSVVNFPKCLHVMLIIHEYITSKGFTLFIIYFLLVTIKFYQ